MSPSSGVVSNPPWVDFKPESLRGGVDRHRVGQARDGRWWWLDPVSGPRFGCGVQGVARSVGNQPVIGQLREWGFNMLPSGTAAGFCNRGIPHWHGLELRRAGGGLIREAGVNLPDVFDPRWAPAVEECVAAVAQTAGLAAYVLDDQWGWGAVPVAGERLERPSLLQVCLSLDPTFAAYHAAWEFVLAPRAGEWARLMRDWGVTAANKETLRQMTLEDRALDSVGYRADLERFTREMAQRYFRTAVAAIRQADPGRLVLSPPLTAAVPTMAREAAVTHSDLVVVTKPGAAGGFAPEWVIDFCWANLGAAEAKEGEAGLSELERMLRRGRSAVEAMILAPQVVGYSWGHYVRGDQSAQGPFAPGLLDENGRVNHVHTMPLAAIQVGATARRMGR